VASLCHLSAAVCMAVCLRSMDCILTWCLQVERFLFRPGLQSRARYYAVLFLNQLPLSHKVRKRLQSVQQYVSSVMQQRI